MSRKRAIRRAREGRNRVSESVMQAHHEAAHAVVSVRLGLPLASTDIRRRAYRLQSGGMVLSGGYTTLVDGTVDSWYDALSDPEKRNWAQDQFHLLAVQCAAGVVAEKSRGVEPNNEAHRLDVSEMLKIASVLGIGESKEDPPVQKWFTSQLERAQDVLWRDDAAAWKRVSTELHRRRTLWGDEVRGIVADEPEAEFFS